MRLLSRSKQASHPLFLFSFATFVRYKIFRKSVLRYVCEMFTFSTSRGLRRGLSVCALSATTRSHGRPSPSRRVRLINGICASRPHPLRSHKLACVHKGLPPRAPLCARVCVSSAFTSSAAPLPACPASLARSENCALFSLIARFRRGPSRCNAMILCQAIRAI